MSGELLKLLGIHPDQREDRKICINCGYRRTLHTRLLDTDGLLGCIKEGNPEDPESTNHYWYDGRVDHIFLPDPVPGQEEGSPQ